MKRLLLLLLAVAGCAAEASDDDTSVGADDALIGGSPATVERFPSTVYLKSGCTAAKVGERLLLTAAHCVLNTSSNSPRWMRGDTLGISRTPSNGFTDVVIVDVHVHPDWKKACDEQYCASSEVTAKLDAPDAAVIEVAQDIVGIPIATVDASPLAPSASVIEIGFGCTEGVSKKDERTSATLLFAPAKLVGADHAVHDGSPVTSPDLVAIGANYVLTDGPGRSAKKSGLCPGDSGGPLYKQGPNGALAVVGINSNYTFAPEDRDPAGLPVTNWHTRVDDGSSHKVASWLKSLGIKLP